jgi:hypothetical protein
MAAKKAVMCKVLDPSLIISNPNGNYLVMICVCTRTQNREPGKLSRVHLVVEPSKQLQQG